MTREYAIVFGVVDLLTAATQIAGQAPVAGYQPTTTIHHPCSTACAVLRSFWPF